MVATVSLVRHSAPADWTPAQRAELQARLAQLGTNITELSDAREECGFERLSEASAEDRADAHLNVQDPQIADAIRRIRTERLELLGELHRERKAVSVARKLLGLRSNRTLRIGELRALLDQTRIVELTAGETDRQAWRAVTAPLHGRFRVAR